MKDKLARFIAGKLDDKQKKQMIEKFKEKNQHRPDVDKLVEDMKHVLKYKKDDV